MSTPASPLTEVSPAERLMSVQGEIAGHCARYGRNPADVNLLAVSKTKPIEAIDAVAAAGQRHFGENYLQEAVAKVEARPGLTWHFIGAIQSNKSRLIARHFDWVHTVASRKVADRLSAARSKDQPALNVCVQVNISNDPAKAGVAADEAAMLLAHIADLPHLQLRGLMALPAQSDSLDDQRVPFAALRTLGEAARARGLIQRVELSMGMSGDLEAAIAEGATWVRIGTAIFGARAPRTT